MTYLFKLARRLAFAHVAAVASIALLACSEPESRDFLGPEPGTPTSSSLPVSLHIAQHPGSVAHNEYMRFAAWGRNGVGDSIAVHVSWTASAGEIGPDGTFRATAAGQQVITAFATNRPSVKASTSVVVGDPGSIFTGLRVIPEPVAVYGGSTVNFAATAKLSANGATTAPAVTWSTNGGSITPQGVLVATSVPGEYQVTAVTADGKLTGMAKVTVKDAELLKVRVLPKAVVIPGGGTQDFLVSANWSDGSTVVPVLEWQSEAGTITPLPAMQGAPGGNGGGGGGTKLTGGTTPGNFKLIAKHPHSGKADTATVTILPVLAEIQLFPGTLSLVSGATATFAASGVMTDGSTVTVPVSWQATGGQISTSGVYLAGPQAGTYRVIATADGGVADTAVVQITQPAATLSSLVIQPGGGTVGTGAIVQFAAQGTWSDGSTAQPSVAWFADGGSISPDGRWTAPATAGTVRVRVVQSGGTKADTAVMTVEQAAPALATLTISPETSAMTGGQSVSFAAAATWTNGGSSVPPLVWSATGGTMGQDGKWKAPANYPGTYKVVAKHSGGTLADTATVQVSELPHVTQIAVSPSVAAVVANGTVQFAATATWSDGQQRAQDFIWQATGGSVNMQGLFTAGSLAGQFVVIAMCTGCAVTDTVGVTISDAVEVPPASLTQLVLNPSSFTLEPGQTRSLSLGATWSDGSTAVPPVSWDATGGTVAGLVYTAGTTAGTYRIIVRHQGGSLADTSLVTVTSAPPLPPSQPPASTLQMTARRLDGGSGTVLVNHAIPLQSGMVPNGYDLTRVTVSVDGTEVPLYVERLSGSWPDGSARGLLLQYEVTLTATQTRPVVLGFGSARAAGTRAKALYTTVNGLPRAVALPTDPGYLVRTEYHAARGVPLAPVGQLTSPTAAINSMETDYPGHSTQHANSSSQNDWHGGATASYDRGYTAYLHWLRTGDVVYWTRGVRIAHLYRVQYLDPAPGGPAVWHGQAETTEMYYRATGDSRVVERVTASQATDGTALGFTFKVFTGLAAHERQGTSWGGLHTPGREPRPKARAVLATVTSHRIGFVSPPVTWANDVSTQLGYLRQGMVRLGEWPRFDACGNASTQTGAVENFQVGMVATAAIEADAYLNGDARAVEVVSQSLTHLWNTSWNATQRGFKYSPIACGSAPGGGLSDNVYPELNMFFIYAAYWLAYRLNSQTWFDRAEQMMAGQAALRSVLIYPKQFDQSYYRYADALAYREAYLNR